MLVHQVVPAGLLQYRLGWPQTHKRSAYPCLLSTRIKSGCHHSWPMKKNTNRLNQYNLSVGAHCGKHHSYPLISGPCCSVELSDPDRDPAHPELPRASARHPPRLSPPPPPPQMVTLCFCLSWSSSFLDHPQDP